MPLTPFPHGGSTCCVRPPPARGRAAAQSEDKLEKVEILLDWKALPTYAGFYLARQMGAFERRGLEVTFAETQGAELAAMIGEGKHTGSAVERHRHGDRPLQGPAHQEPRRLLPKTPTVIFSRTEDRIAHPRDLYGKTLGLVPGSITNEELRALVAVNKLDRSKIKETRSSGTPMPWSRRRSMR